MYDIGDSIFLQLPVFSPSPSLPITNRHYMTTSSSPYTHSLTLPRHLPFYGFTVRVTKIFLIPMTSSIGPLVLVWREEVTSRDVGH